MNLAGTCPETFIFPPLTAFCQFFSIRTYTNKKISFQSLSFRQTVATALKNQYLTLSVNIKNGNTKDGPATKRLSEKTLLFLPSCRSIFKCTECVLCVISAAVLS